MVTPIQTNRFPTFAATTAKPNRFAGQSDRVTFSGAKKPDDKFSWRDFFKNMGSEGLSLGFNLATFSIPFVLPVFLGMSLALPIIFHRFPKLAQDEFLKPLTRKIAVRGLRFVKRPIQTGKQIWNSLVKSTHPKWQLTVKRPLTTHIDASPGHLQVLRAYVTKTRDFLMGIAKNDFIQNMAKVRPFGWTWFKHALLLSSELFLKKIPLIRYFARILDFWVLNNFRRTVNTDMVNKIKNNSGGVIDVLKSLFAALFYKKK